MTLYAVISSSGKPLWWYPRHQRQQPTEQNQERPWWDFPHHLQKKQSTFTDEEDDDEGFMARLGGLAQTIQASVALQMNDDQIQMISSAHTVTAWLTVTGPTHGPDISSAAVTLLAHHAEDRLGLPFVVLRWHLELLYTSLVMKWTMLRIPTDSLGWGAEAEEGALLHHRPPILLRPDDWMWGIESAVLEPALRKQLETALARVLRESVSAKLDEQPPLLALLLNAEFQLTACLPCSQVPCLLHLTDLQVLLTHLRDTGADNGLWLPVCLPHFHAQGYLYCFVGRMSSLQNSKLVLLSSNASLAQKVFFQQLTRSAETALSSINSSPLGAKVSNNREIFNKDREDEYLDVVQARHFLFRLYSTAQHKQTHPQHLVQRLVSTSSPADTTKKHGEDRMWHMYPQLSLRLRLGSACDRVLMNAMAGVKEGQRGDKKNERADSHHPTIVDHCPLSELLNARPSIQGVTYATVNDCTYLAMCGKNFELYTTSSSSLLPEEAAAYAAKLTRRILQDQQELFASPVFYDVE